MTLNHNQAVRLTRRLRELRESEWPGHVLTQAQLAAAFSSENRVAPATLSSWESATNPKTPTEARITEYARFFCTKQSLEGGPHLVPEDQLTQAELHRFQELETELLTLLHPEDRNVRHSFQFDAGPVVVICPDLPAKARGPLANESDINFTKMQQYGDLDALIELYGHLCAENPTLDVLHRLASEAESDDLSSHVIVLGGVGWNEITRHIQRAISHVPIRQVAVDDLVGGDIFYVRDSEVVKSFYPKYEELPDRKDRETKDRDGKDRASKEDNDEDRDDTDRDDREFIADVGYLARLRNPFKVDRTLTICNGIHSRGVLGAVRCLTDVRIREENEKFLANRFPSGEFAVLLGVPVVGNKTMTPDLQNPESLLYEWTPTRDARPSVAPISVSTSG